MMIIAVMADKGGVGKTTAAHNIAVEIAGRGHAVLMIDADKQADLTELCGVVSEPNIGMDAILRQVPTPSAQGYVRNIGPHLDLLGTHPSMRKADRELAQRTRREYVLDESLRDIRAKYDVIVIDVGHSEMVQINVLVIADVLVVPSTPAKLDADHIANMIEEAEFMRAELRLPSLVKSDSVVVNITRRSTNAAIETSGLDLIRSSFDGMVSPSIVPFTPRVMEASAMKMSLRQYRDSAGQREKVLSAAVNAYALLADHLLSRSAELSGAA